MADWRHRFAHINGIDVHYVEQGAGPLVVLLHGFPHLWYSWRHQIGPLAAAGYRVVAPDLRGFGRTSAPAAVEAYDVPAITADLLGLLDHLGERTATFGGLDFGMMAAYDLAYQHPGRVRALIALQNPFLNHGSRPPSQVAAEIGREHFHHMHYFGLPSVAEADLDARPREFLTRVFHTLSGAGDYLHTWQSPPGTHYVDAMQPAPPLPWPWLNEAELELYVENYSASGFLGPLNWYRAGDLRWEQRKDFEGRLIEVPYFFVGSEKDIDLAVFHGRDPLERFGERYADVREVRILPAAGHLMQMEQSGPVTAAMLDFLQALDRAD